MKKLFTNNPLFFAFLFPALVDAIWTIAGQDSSYWQNPQSAREGGPLYYILVTSPFLYMLLAVLWFIFLYWLLKKLKSPYNLIVAIMFISGHTWGSSTWIIKSLSQSPMLVSVSYREIFLVEWTVMAVYCIIIAVFAGLSINYYFTHKK